jgi:hypothetical protein
MYRLASDVRRQPAALSTTLTGCVTLRGRCPNPIQGGPEMAVCAHTVCTCEASGESDYCSPFCEANPDAAECHCHHGHCAAPHSH